MVLEIGFFPCHPWFPYSKNNYISWWFRTPSTRSRPGEACPRCRLYHQGQPAGAARTAVPFEDQWENVRSQRIFLEPYRADEYEDEFLEIHIRFEETSRDTQTIFGVHLIWMLKNGLEFQAQKASRPLLLIKGLRFGDSQVTSASAYFMFLELFLYQVVYISWPSWQPWTWRSTEGKHQCATRTAQEAFGFRPWFQRALRCF